MIYSMFRLFVFILHVMLLISCINDSDDNGSPISVGHYHIQRIDDGSWFYNQYLVFPGNSTIEFAEYGYEEGRNGDSTFFQLKRRQGQYKLTEDSLFVSFTRDSTIYRYGGLIEEDYKPFPFQSIPEKPYSPLAIRNVTGRSFELQGLVDHPSNWKLLLLTAQPEDAY